MSIKPDIVALKWVAGLMSQQAENAEMSLVEYSNEPDNKQALLECMWAVHQITSTLRTLGMAKGEMLTLEMERALHFLYKDQVRGERRKLTMGGLMRALKVFPAYLAHTQSTRYDTGHGLERFVNDLRRWLGERPRPRAYFFHMDIPAGSGISAGSQPATDEVISECARVMLALYLEMAKQALKQRNVAESMKTVARISRKMQVLCAGTIVERFWFSMVGLCEGIASGLIVPDECIAQLFKTGAFLIKYAAENGGEIDPSVDYENCQQQLMYYIVFCPASPVHISAVRKAFGVNAQTVESAGRGLIHMDALVIALESAMQRLDKAIDFINGNDLVEYAGLDPQERDPAILDDIEAAQYRLEAASLFKQADRLQNLHGKLTRLCGGSHKGNMAQMEQVVSEIIRGIVEVKIDVEQKIAHGPNSDFCSRDFELRQIVVSATFNQMGLVENYLHQILQYKALANALARKPHTPETVERLTQALRRHLSKSDQGHEALREALRESDRGALDIDLLYTLAVDYQEEQDVLPERDAVSLSLQLLGDISGALQFTGMKREGRVMEQCHDWLNAASKSGSVREDDGFRCFAESFAQVELHLQRSVTDPQDETSHMLILAEQRAEELAERIEEFSAGADVAISVQAQAPKYVEDTEIPQGFRSVFIEEAEEIVAELACLGGMWAENPQLNEVLRDIRRHFHTFKGNGRAVGANVLGELGWAAQDMLDRVLEGDVAADSQLRILLADVINTLPALVLSYKEDAGLDLEKARELTNKCFRMAKSTGRKKLVEDLPIMDAELAAHGRSADREPLSEIIGH